MNNELIVILYDLCLAFFVYVWLYPKLQIESINRLSLYDLVVSFMTLIIGWFLFGGKDIAFSLYFTDTNWYWFTIVVYFIIETPFALWYMKKYNLTL